MPTFASRLIPFPNVWQIDGELPPIDYSNFVPGNYEVYVTQIAKLNGSETGIGILGDAVIQPLGLIFVSTFPNTFHERVVNLTNAGAEITGIVSKVSAEAIDIGAVCAFFDRFGVTVSLLPLYHPITLFDTLFDTLSARP